MAKGIIFQPQASNPIPANNNGLWCNTSNEVVFVNQTNSQTNIISLLSGGLPAVATKATLLNNTGSTFPKAKPVSINTSGEIQAVDVTTEANAMATVGVAEDAIVNTASGGVITNGLVTNIATSFAFGNAIFIAPSGNLTNIYPSIGNADGFLAGDFVIRVGVISKNSVTPANKDLIVCVSVVGQL